MSIDSKFKSGVVWNLLSLGILAVSGILINFIIAHYAGSEALGVFNQAFAYYIVASQLAVLGVQFSILKSLSYHQDDLAKCASVVVAGLSLVVFTSGAVAVLTYFASTPVAKLLDSPAVAKALMCLIPGLFCYSVNKVLIASMNGLRHMRAYAIFQSLRYIFILTFLWWLLLHDYSSGHLLLALTCSELLLFVLLFIYVFGFMFGFLPSLTSIGRLIRDHFQFGLKASASGMIIELNTRVDILMLGYFCSDALVGIYSFAAILAEGLKQLPGVVRWNVDPVIGKYYSEGKLGEIESFSASIRKKLFPAMLGLGLIGILLYTPIIELFDLDPELILGWPAFSILIVGVVGNSLCSPMMGVLLQGNRPGLHSILTLAILGTNICLNAIFIQFFGLVGAALATASVFLLEAYLLKILASRAVRVSI